MINLSNPLGWYFGKTAGLLGTMNNEPSDDLLTPNRQKMLTSEIQTFAQSWSLDEECSSEDGKYIPSDTSEEIKSMCDSLYESNISPFVTCFSRVPPQYFLQICLSSKTLEEICTSAFAYTKLCSVENTPLRIPDTCIK